MYLKSIDLINFRKFGTNENRVEFVDNISIDEGVNIAKKATLIVGKNNSGKTSVISALEKLVNKGSKFYLSDFNIIYLKELLIRYFRDKENINNDINFSFKICIGLDTNIENDIFTNIIPLLTLEENIEEINIIAKVEYKEVSQIINKLAKVLQSQSNKEFFNKNKQPNKNFDELFRDCYNAISKEELTVNYYDKKNNQIKDFNLSNLIEIKCINANNLKEENALSKAFNKILTYKLKEISEDNDIDGQIKKLNLTIDKFINKNYANVLKNNVKDILTADKVGVDISSNIKIENLLGKLVEYSYIDNGNLIPESQFGLGYTNIMMIIADIIDYLEKYPNTAFNSKINILSIEEPETFMHPQLQENFIKRIEEGIKLLLGEDKNINTQLILTSHSAHILNSKIHSGDTFNNIIYMNSHFNESIIRKLNDKLLVDSLDGTKDENLKTLKFIKKHITYSSSSLFFADAVIFVEGDTEEHLLPYYLQKDAEFKNKFITIINIDGKHMQVYLKLIEILKIPCMAICDVDIERSENEKDTFYQITTLKDRESSNYIISVFNETGYQLDKIKINKLINNLHVVTQCTKIEGYFATSLEEAFILTNYKNQILQNSLKETIPVIFNGIVGSGNNVNIDNLKANSYKIQIKLKNKKTEFINELLFQMINCDEISKLPILPKYINDGLKVFKKMI